MPQTPYIFTRLTNLLPKDVFDRMVKKHNGNAGGKSYSCWNHLLVMVWAQLTSRQSLRGIEMSLRAHSDKLYRMGIGRSVSRNNIAYANAKREVALYRDFAQEMMARCASLSMKDKTLRFYLDTSVFICSWDGIKGTFYILGFLPCFMNAISKPFLHTFAFCLKHCTNGMSFTHMW